MFQYKAKNVRSFSIAALMALAFSFSGCSQQEVEKENNISSRNLAEQAYQLLNQRQPKAALSIFEQAIAADEKNAQALQGKALALNNLGRHLEAEKYYQKALEIEPESPSIINNLAMSKILRGHYTVALKMLEPLVKDDPDNIKAQDNTALAYCMLGRKEEAKKIYSLRLDSKQVEENLRFCTEFEEIRKK